MTAIAKGKDLWPDLCEWAIDAELGRLELQALGYVKHGDVRRS